VDLFLSPHFWLELKKNVELHQELIIVEVREYKSRILCLSNSFDRTSLRNKKGPLLQKFLIVKDALSPF
jgi:hypothetical protein